MARCAALAACFLFPGISWAFVEEEPHDVMAALQVEATRRPKEPLAAVQRPMRPLSSAGWGDYLQMKLQVQNEAFNNSVYQEISIQIDINTETDASDPIWEQLYSQLHSASNNTIWNQLCDIHAYDHYNDLSCSPTAAGSYLFGSLCDEPGACPWQQEGAGLVFADAFFCGSQNSGINWAKDFHVANLCDAEVGSAYTPTGVCGSVPKKDLVLGFQAQVSRRGAPAVDPRSINVPAVDCVMGIVDCDIYYCQKCAGRCNAAGANPAGFTHVPA